MSDLNMAGGSESTRVSIVTPSYNHGQYLERTILSVLSQDYPDIEYVVVDGLSKDATPKILKKYAKRLARVIREADAGQADAINKGFRLTSGEIMAYLNSDDCYASPFVVAKAVELFRQHPNVDVIYGTRRFIDEQGFFALNQPFQEFDENALKKACYIPQECVFWRRSIYAKAGYFVDTKFDFAMDYELWLRFLHFGAKFLAVDENFGLFRWYKSQKSQEAWTRVGLPEIQLLQERYLGKCLSAAEITEAHDKVLFGIGRKEHEQVWAAIHPAWIDFIEHKRNGLKACPLDIWFFQGSYAR